MRGAGGAAGAMEGVLYKWTNYLSGEWRRGAAPLSERPEGDAGTRLPGAETRADPTRPTPPPAAATRSPEEAG